MRYELKQKILALGDDFTIRDENGQDAYFVDGKAFSLGKQLSFQDMGGNELAYIRQKLLSFKPTYHIFIGGEPWAIVQKELFSFFKCRFVIDLPGPDDIEAEGNFLDHEYRFVRRGDTVAHVSKQWFSLRDTYGVDILDDEQSLAILCGVVVIDLLCHDRKR